MQPVFAARSRAAASGSTRPRSTRRQRGRRRARRARDPRPDAVDARRVLGRPGGRRYHAAYYEDYPGVWRHGDWILFTERGSCIITGRSDATLNRGGVRMGTGEFYEVVEELDEVLDSLVVHLEDDEGGPGELLLFVVLADGAMLDDALRARIGGRCAARCPPATCRTPSRRRPAIPRTLTGKKLELPVKRMLRGAARPGREPRRARRPGARSTRSRRTRGPARPLGEPRAARGRNYNPDNLRHPCVHARGSGRCAIPHTAVITQSRLRRCGAACAGSAVGHGSRARRGRGGGGGGRPPAAPVRFTFRQKNRCVVASWDGRKGPTPSGQGPRTRRRRDPSPRPAVATNVTSARHEGTH